MSAEPPSGSSHPEEGGQPAAPPRRGVPAAPPPPAPNRRQWVYASNIKGRFQTIHRWSGVALQALLFVTPWLSLGGYPLLQLDLPARRLYIFGAIFTSTDTIFLLLILLGAALSLFFMTSLFGRIWCGYACPQTVFLEEWVRPIEALLEGDRGVRMARDKGPWNFDKAWRKAAKWTAFAAVAVLVSMTFISYFSGAYPLWTGQASATEYGLVGAFSFLLFWNFSWFREQFCNFLCPYARFQGALTDDQSLVIRYDAVRGEPRGKSRAKDKDGGCIDCNKCVTVCPQGIDIRNGFQLECINCGRCIDACETVMGKMDQPSLVHYTTLAEEKGETTRWLRPRTVVYAAGLTLIATIFLAMLIFHHTLAGSVNRAPGSLFTVDNDGWVRNTYMVKVTNQDPDPAGVTVKVSVDGLPANADIKATDVPLKAGESKMVPLIVRVPPDAGLAHTIPLVVHLTAERDAIQVDTTFKNMGGS